MRVTLCLVVCEFAPLTQVPCVQCWFVASDESTTLLFISYQNLQITHCA